MSHRPALVLCATKRIRKVKTLHCRLLNGPEVRCLWEATEGSLGTAIEARPQVSKQGRAGVRAESISR
jgi:hypothetical protein